MARAVRSVKKAKGGSARPKSRARRVTVAKEKSRSRSGSPRTSPKATSRATAGGSVLAKARTKLAKAAKSGAKTVKAVKAGVKAAKLASAPATPRRKAEAPAAAPRRERKPLPPPTAEALVDELAATGLTDEEQIESAKYQPRRATAKARVFEEERFLFPQSYGVNRLRLLVKDPEWLFAYWDVDPKSLEALRAELGNRATALSQLTLRVFEDRNGGASTFLLPQGSRTWYVPASKTGRVYRAEVGVILPTGEFRPLARSNSVGAPRVGRSAQKAKRRVRYDRTRPMALGAVGMAAADEAPEAPDAESSWDTPGGSWPGPEEEQRPSARSRGGTNGERGGASDVHRR
jgi:hypothetical protein